jgi:hypothetical protein
LEEAPLTIPTWWLNSVIATFLLPIAGLLTGTFFNAFSEATVEHAFWATEEFWFFGLGSLLWILWFFGSIWSFGEPRPMRAYIFGHELTHAIWVWLMGGRVKHFEVRRDGGHILTDTHNFWIALAPYFYPIYSMAIMAVYGAVSLFYNIGQSEGLFLSMTALQWLFLALGASWAFHMSFTCWMIPKGQSDLTSHGTYFSLVVIYIVNLSILSGFLIIAAPEVTLLAFGEDLLVNTENVAAILWDLLIRPAAWFA